MNWTLLSLIVIPLTISLGQLLFKAASRTAGAPSLASVLSLLFNPFFIAAVLLYGMATLAWIFVLRGVPVGRAYQFMSLSFVAVPLGACLAFGEALGLRQIAGICIIVAGLFVSSL